MDFWTTGFSTMLVNSVGITEISMKLVDFKNSVKFSEIQITEIFEITDINEHILCISNQWNLMIMIHKFSFSDQNSEISSFQVTTSEKSNFRI